MAQILKKNIVSVVCGVVALLAVIAYFVFVTGLYTGANGLEAKAKERKDKYDQLSALLSKPRTLPVVELNSSTPVPLEVFPTPDVIKAGMAVTDQLKTQSGLISGMATKLNRRAPLLPGFFPKPTDPMKYRFRDAYRVHMEKEIPAMLNAAAPPTEADVQKAREKLWRDKYQERIIVINGREANREQVDREYLEETQGLLEVLERQVAQKYRMYIETGAINTNTGVLSEETPPNDQIWYAQTALWVQDELAASIASFNDLELQRFKPADRNLINAPVKHLINMQVPQGVDQYIAKASTGAEGETPPGQPDFKLSPTGRNSNALYDVVKFTMVVKLDARYMPRFIQELSRGKFVTIHKVNFTAVDNAQAKADGFVYGTAPIVQMQLAGESLLMRDWTSPLVPETVKKNLPQFAEPGAAAAGTQTAAAQ